MKRSSILLLPLVAAIGGALAEDRDLGLSQRRPEVVDDGFYFLGDAMSFVNKQVEQSSAYFQQLFGAMLPLSGEEEEQVQIVIVEEMVATPLTSAEQDLACTTALNQVQVQQEIAEDSNRLRASLRAIRFPRPIQLFSLRLSDPTTCEDLADARVVQEVRGISWGIFAIELAY